MAMKIRVEVGAMAVLSRVFINDELRRDVIGIKVRQDHTGMTIVDLCMEADVEYVIDDDVQVVHVKDPRSLAGAMLDLRAPV